MANEKKSKTKPSNAKSSDASPKKKVTLKKAASSVKVKAEKPKKVEQPKPIQRMKVAEHFVYATGRRKESTAKVWMFKGTGVVKINHQDAGQYLNSPRLVSNCLIPVVALNLDKQYDIRIDVLGGGLTGQADAAKLAISRAILELNSDYRSQLKSLGLLTQDSREKERKKYGKRGARKSPQFRKR